MRQDEFVEIANLVTDETQAIVHGQRVLAGIHEELDRNQFHPFEQDIIYAEHFGQKPSEPQRFVLDGVTITTRILHQTGLGLRDIRGADFLYEIDGEKYALIQFKKADDKLSSVKNDIAQLESLLSNCPEVCMYKHKQPSTIPFRMNGYCGCWYRIDDAKGNYLLHACEARAIFAGRKTARSTDFSSGINRELFAQLFAKCRIGAVIRLHKPTDTYIPDLLERRHIIFQTTQGGRWQR